MNTKATESQYRNNPMPKGGRWTRVPCPNCMGANRTAKRACKKQGPERCNGTGFTWVSLADNEL